MPKRAQAGSLEGAETCSTTNSLCPGTRRDRDFATGDEIIDVEIFLGQCRLLLLRAERDLPSSPANLRNLSRIAVKLANSIESVP
jgi:hypothetical protein